MIVSRFSAGAGLKSGQSNRIKNLTKCNFIFLTPMEWDKKIPLGRQDQQDGQDIAILKQNNPDNPVNPV
jgi:hypothetical protein